MTHSCKHRSDRRSAAGRPAGRPALDAIRGGALLVAVVITVPIVGFSAAMLFVSVHVSEEVVSDHHRSRSFNAAEVGVAMAVEDIVAGGDGNVSGTLAGGRATFEATTLGVADNKFEVLSDAVEDGETRSIEAGVELVPVETVTADLAAAVVANSEVSITGNNQADGRDWDELGANVVGPGVYGIQTTDIVSRSGNAKIGGHGNVPAKNENETQQGYSWANGLDDDNDGTIDEEANDGVDNDGDEEVDEDVDGYFDGPDAVVNLAAGTLKESAIAYGTYFTSGADLDAYANANGGKLPGGKIYYLEASSYGPVNWDMDLTGDPAILVVHVASGNASVKNWHADFKGLLIADEFDKFNGTPVILGAVVTLTTDSAGVKFANGNARIRYSSAVLGKLPSTAVEPKVQFLSWREVY